MYKLRFQQGSLSKGGQCLPLHGHSHSTLFQKDPGSSIRNPTVRERDAVRTGFSMKVSAGRAAWNSISGPCSESGCLVAEGRSEGAGRISRLPDPPMTPVQTQRMEAFHHGPCALQPALSPALAATAAVTCDNEINLCSSDVGSHSRDLLPHSLSCP